MGESNSNTDGQRSMCKLHLEGGTAVECGQGLLGEQCSHPRRGSGLDIYRPQNTVGMELPVGLVSPTGVGATSTGKLRSHLPALSCLQPSFVWKTTDVEAKEGTQALMGTSDPY